MKREWVTEIRDQCQVAKVPFFFKQWGGVQKNRTGRELEGRTWDEMPRSNPAPDRKTLTRCQTIAR
jgi:protein gp37